MNRLAAALALALVTACAARAPSIASGRAPDATTDGESAMESAMESAGPPDYDVFRWGMTKATAHRTSRSSGKGLGSCSWIDKRTRGRICEGPRYNIGGIAMTSALMFPRDALKSIILTTDSDNYDTLKAMLTERYGPAQTEEIFRAFWTTEDGRTMIGLSRDISETSITYLDDARATADLEERVQDGASKL